MNGSSSICPSLHRLGLLLQAVYRLRMDHLTSGTNGEALAQTELDLVRVNNLILRHRSLCRLCKFNEALKDSLRRDNEAISIARIDS
jgi:hypothetical protein